MVEIEAVARQQPPRAPRFLDPLVGQPDVPPAGEPILQIPLRLAVAQQDEGRHQATVSTVLVRTALVVPSSGRIAWSASRHEAARYLERSGDQP